MSCSRRGGPSKVGRDDLPAAQCSSQRGSRNRAQRVEATQRRCPREYRREWPNFDAFDLLIVDCDDVRCLPLDSQAGGLLRIVPVHPTAAAMGLARGPCPSVEKEPRPLTDSIRRGRSCRTRAHHPRAREVARVPQFAPVAAGTVTARFPRCDRAAVPRWLRHRRSLQLRLRPRRLLALRC